MSQQPLTFLATTPRSVSPAIAFFCSQISANHSVYIPVERHSDSFFKRNIHVRNGKRAREGKRKVRKHCSCHLD